MFIFTNRFRNKCSRLRRPVYVLSALNSISEFFLKSNPTPPSFNPTYIPPLSQSAPCSSYSPNTPSLLSPQSALCSSYSPAPPAASTATPAQRCSSQVTATAPPAPPPPTPTTPSRTPLCPCWRRLVALVWVFLRQSASTTVLLQSNLATQHF